MTRSYDQMCALARGLDVVGDRWSLLVVRELLLGPKRFTDLAEGLPGIPPSVLAERLRDLRQAGLVDRRRLPPPAASTVYELTEAGRALEEALYALTRWGVRYGRPPKSDDTVRTEWTILSLRALFRPDRASGVEDTYEVRIPEDAVTARVRDGRLSVEPGSAGEPDVVLHLSPEGLMAVVRGEMSPDEALRAGLIRLEGDRGAFRRFCEVFGFVPGAARAGAGAAAG